MPRRILFILFTLPVLLSLITWAWSTTHNSTVGYIHRGNGVAVGTNSGVVAVLLLTGTPADGWLALTARQSPEYFYPNEPPDYLVYFIGFGLGHQSGGGSDYYALSLPYWFLIILFSLLLCVVIRITRPRPAPAAFPIEPSTF